jgi:hypothetical protein
MPTSPSPKRSISSPKRSTGTKRRAPEPAPRSPLLRPLILVVILAVLAVMVIALPASLISRFLPRDIVAEDFSGSLWHGSAGKITANGRNVGALEWRLHPAALLTRTLSADIHWVKVGFVADGTAEITSQGATLHAVQGGGPLADIAEFGIVRNFRGLASFNFREIKIAFGSSSAPSNPTLLAALGDLKAANVTSPQIAGGADLGGYALHLAEGPAELTDTGGPLEVQATINFSADTHTGTLSGTIKERPDASPALRREVQNLLQLHQRDAAGRIPVDLEFTF